MRIARRDAWRFKGRSFLVLAMIALPILGVSAADLTVRSSQLSPEQKLDREIGQADGELQDPRFGGVPVLQPPDPINALPVGNYDNKPYPSGPTDIRKALPPGATSLERTVGQAKLRTTHGVLNADVDELKASAPLARGIMTLKDGHFPERADEVAATTHFLQASGLRVGSKLTARGLSASFRIVGEYELPDSLKADEVNPLPGALLAPLGKALAAEGLSLPDISSSQLVSVPGGFSWAMVGKANAQGVSVYSREVTLHPPADSDIPYYRQYPKSSVMSDSTENTAGATVAGLAMLEICLLAGPAFAVGARRSRRQLGLVGANGGDRRTIRAIVLSGGLVIGVASAVIGTVLGLGLTVALRTTLEDYVGARFGGITVRPLELLGIALLAVLTGALAALVPAITASRQPVLASLTGRRGVRRSSRTLPVLGLVAFLLGGVIALYGSLVSDESVVVAGGSGIAELGVVAMTPVLVGLFGRLSRWLPLSPRLALRDSVRNRGRTAPAVAAVLAAVAGTVAVATYTASTTAQNRAEYTAQLPRGVATAMLFEDRGRDVPALRRTVEQNLPVDVRADVDQIDATTPKCLSEGECGQARVVVPTANRCPLDTAGPDDPRETLPPAKVRALAADWRCATDTVGSVGGTDGVLIGDASLLTVLGIKDPAAVAALAKGQVASFDRRNVYEDHRIAIRLITDSAKADAATAEGEEPPGEVKKLAAYQVTGTPESYGISMIIPKAAAKAAGLPTAPLGAYYSTSRMPTGAEQQKLDEILSDTGNYVQFQLEQGYVDKNDIITLALAIFAGLVTIGAAGIATGLAQADAEADLNTLAAIGAPARVRRTLSGFQCGVVAGMGVLLGSAAGVLPAIGLRLIDRRSAQDAYQQALDQGRGYLTIPHVAIVLPWGTLLALLIAVPLGAALLAALVTRSQPPAARRAAS
jgi:putative ABC transport system permease protein